MKIRPYFAFGRKQLRVGFRYRKGNELWWRHRFIGFTWQ